MPRRELDHKRTRYLSRRFGVHQFRLKDFVVGKSNHHTLHGSGIGVMGRRITRIGDIRHLRDGQLPRCQPDGGTEIECDVFHCYDWLELLEEEVADEDELLDDDEEDDDDDCEEELLDDDKSSIA